jgi:L-ribulose-5-phosphate 3-epimerase
MLQIGYNTNGFNCHSLASAIEIIATIGYQGIAISLDFGFLNPYDSDIARQVDVTRGLLERFRLSCVVETGARFLLDPWRKHFPTLISPETEQRAIRLDFLKRSLAISRDLDATALSFWSGAKPGAVTDPQAWSWLASACQLLSDQAETVLVPLAFEPEPGMFIETLSQYDRLQTAVGHPLFGLTLDLGHVFLTETVSVGQCIKNYHRDIRNIHIEDMRGKVHDHLFFGEGDMNFPEIFSVLKDIDYRGPINAELSRHSHNAVETARGAFAFLQKCQNGSGGKALVPCC